MKLSELLKLHILKRLPAILAAAVVCTLFSLYYVGILDVSFIERPESWENNIHLFNSILDPREDTPADAEDDKEKEENTNKDKDKDKDKDNKKEQNKKPQSSTSVPIYQAMTFSSVSEMKKQGYFLTSKPYDDSCVFAKLTMDYDWPEEFTYSWKAYDKEKVTTYEDGTESTVETVRYSGERAALELYMGYIIYDNDGELFLIGPDGAVLTKYNDNEYIPAYTRDKDGRPLFYKNTTYTEKYPTVLGKENEDGEREWKKTGTLTVKDKIYYYLSPNGQYFQKSDYNDATDNRGLYFDYPTYYGTTDSNLKRYYRYSTKIFTDLKGETSVLDDMNWMFSPKKVDVLKYEFDRDGLLITDKEPKEGEEPETLKSLFPYTMAYNYSENYASVFMDIDWSYDHDVKNEEGKTEKKTFDVTTNELRIINNKGDVMFESKKNFFSNFSWTAHEKYSAPLLSGIDSIGSYYFDHGLMRLRVQSWDCYYFAEFDTVKIVTDEDILIRPNGEQFLLPTGYKLISYSDGVLLLEKDGKYGYMNHLSNWIRNPELLDGNPFLEGVAVCKNSEGYYGVIDTNGKAVIPFNYRYISNISSGTLVAYSDYSGWTVFQKLTK